ncbi:AraC family transcriptional regulator [Mycobacterium sp. SMC-19]|uniref:AraC family transcriptional regulator n=1 Tax=Mycobacterium sp. SMC-19 TaxID=3381630 RepID=UPI0038766E99
MGDLISAASLSHLPELLSEIGCDPTELLGDVGIDMDMIGAHDRYIPFSALSTVLGTVAHKFEIPDVALRLAARQHPDILGPVAIVARNADTVGAALQSVAEYSHVYSPAIATALHLDDDFAAFEFRTLLRRLPFRDHVVELALGFMHGLFTMLAGPEFRPLRVTFEHPRISEREVYVRNFACPVDFEAPRNSMIFPRALLDRKITQVDTLAYDLAVRFMAGADRDTAFLDVVADTVKRALPAGAASLKRVAALLIMHPRTVQRRLAESGTTFDELLDQVRRDIAEGLLANPNVPLSTVARQLGYSEQSSLTRSCRRWFDTTPRGRRRELSHRYGSG